VALKKLDTGQQFYQNQRGIHGPVSSHVAGQQRGAKGDMAVRGKMATRLVFSEIIRMKSVAIVSGVKLVKRIE
jgi:hypothetical protein